MSLATLEQRIRDRLTPEWLTPSQQRVWEQLHRFHGPPHRVVNVYGPPGVGKSFLGWLMQREGTPPMRSGPVSASPSTPSDPGQRADGPFQCALCETPCRRAGDSSGHPAVAPASG